MIQSKMLKTMGVDLHKQLIYPVRRPKQQQKNSEILEQLVSSILIEMDLPSAVPNLKEVSSSQLLAELKRRHGHMVKQEKRVIFVGAPGCGKGTQSAIVKERFHLAHLSTGDMLREAIAAESELGKQVMLP